LKTSAYAKIHIILDIGNLAAWRRRRLQSFTFLR
jgi:hypothetical protein